MNLIVAGIHTGIGKTLCSAVLCNYLGYDYWKPVQAGNLDETDSHFIRDHVTNPTCRIHPETYRLKAAASPHYAADLENTKIEISSLQLPETRNSLVVETAGGLMSPFSLETLNIDLCLHFRLPVILVSNNYLGSINHTLLSVEALKNRGIKILGLVFSGEDVPSTRKFILSYTRLPFLFSIPFMDVIDKETVSSFSSKLSFSF